MSINNARVVVVTLKVSKLFQKYCTFTNFYYSSTKRVVLVFCAIETQFDWLKEEHFSNSRNSLFCKMNFHLSLQWPKKTLKRLNASTSKIPSKILLFTLSKRNGDFKSLCLSNCRSASINKEEEGPTFLYVYQYW